MLITHAAIMYSNGEIIEGHDYGQVTATGNKLGFGGEKIHGFITSSGDFLLPDQAAIVAFEAGQITAPTDELKPDDLWPEYVVE